MVLPVPYPETVTLLRPGASTGRDELGLPVPGPVEEIVLTGCVVTPRQEAERIGGPAQQGRDTVVTGWTVYVPPGGTVVLTTDRMLIRGETCEVLGHPEDWGRSPFTGTRGPQVVIADRITG